MVFDCNSPKICNITFSNLCLKPDDSLFNWPVRKDKPGTIKEHLPTLSVPPPSAEFVYASRKQRSSRSRRNYKRKESPTLLVLSPEFWSNTQSEARTKKQKIVFKCRHNTCETTFSTPHSRLIHEKMCITDVKVFHFL